MKSSLKTKSVAQNSYVLSGIKSLADLNVEMSVAVSEEGTIVRAHVTSGKAAAMLKPMGRKALGSFWPLANNMVFIDASVSVRTAGQMLAAAKNFN